MTSRRGTLIEQGAKELLQAHGYTVRVIPVGFDKRLPPAHLVASKATGETRLIRVRKISHLPISVRTIETHCMQDVTQFRKYRAQHLDATGLRCEVWTYSLYHGFRPFEVQQDSIRETVKLTLGRSIPSETAGVP